MLLTRAKGHRRLKLSFAHVLTLIQPAGARIQQIAATQDVSKQAISAIASELEELGYLQRQVDAGDARQIVLQFTERGQQLIADSVQSVDELETEFAAIIGSAALQRLTTAIAALYRGLRLEQDIFEQGTEPGAGQPHTATSISALARQLQRQLSDRDSQALARLLLKPATNKR
jgi:DNA-binding MarR family transcriptional regulator